MGAEPDEKRPLLAPLLPVPPPPVDKTNRVNRKYASCLSLFDVSTDFRVGVFRRSTHKNTSLQQNTLTRYNTAAGDNAAVSLTPTTQHVGALQNLSPSPLASTFHLSAANCHNGRKGRNYRRKGKKQALHKTPSTAVHAPNHARYQGDPYTYERVVTFVS